MPLPPRDFYITRDERVEIAKALWTHSQMLECPVLKDPDRITITNLIHASLSNGVLQHGPITNHDGRVTVTLY